MWGPTSCQGSCDHPRGHHSAGAGTVVGAACSGDFTVLGEILGEVFGDFDVGFVSDGFEVCGGVLGSDADFSVSFFNTWKRCENISKIPKL